MAGTVAPNAWIATSVAALTTAPTSAFCARRARAARARVHPVRSDVRGHGRDDVRTARVELERAHGIAGDERELCAVGVAGDGEIAA